MIGRLTGRIFKTLGGGCSSERFAKCGGNRYTEAVMHDAPAGLFPQMKTGQSSAVPFKDEVSLVCQCRRKVTPGSVAQ